MALIICPECGKRYSSFAAACPECGCPTGAGAQPAAPAATARPAVNAEAESKAASEALRSAVRNARAQAKSAENLFDRRNDAIQDKASRDIDLFGGNATKTIVDISADAREACDDLYASYQSLIEQLDRRCRPLLAKHPEPAAIKEVRDLIRWLNEESEIENNFTASFNGASLGNVANAKYVPQMSNKLIQKFWEDQYASTPAAQEDAKRQAEQAKKRAELRRAQEEAQKKQAEEKKKLREQQERLGQELEQHMQIVKAHCDRKVAVFREMLRAEQETRAADVALQLSEKAEELRAERAALQLQAAAPGGKDRRETLQAIEILSSRIAKLSEKSVLDREIAKLTRRRSAAVEAYEDRVEDYLSKRFPNRDANKKPFEKYREDEAYRDAACPEPPSAEEVFREQE